MFAVLSCSTTLKGLSFSIADLLQVKAWSEAHSLHMVARLDHGADDEEYEEVIAFHSAKSPLCRWILWRNSDRVFVQPLIGRTRSYNTVSEAIETLLPERQPVFVTDIKVTPWPSQTISR